VANDLSALECEVKKMKQQSDAAASAEEKQALRSTVLVLEAQLRARQHDLDDRRAAVCLQQQRRDSCESLVTSFDDELSRMERWVNDATIVHAGQPLASYGPAGLGAVVGECQVISC
jgi:hypothetical protein